LLLFARPPRSTRTGFRAVTMPLLRGSRMNIWPKFLHRCRKAPVPTSPTFQVRSVSLEPKCILFSVHDRHAFVSSDRVLQRGDGSNVAEIRADCLSCRSSLRDASDAGMTLMVCVLKSNGTLILDDEQSQVTIIFWR